MDRIKSLEAYKEIVGQAKQEGCKLSNCFFLPDAIRQKTGAGTLLYEPIEGGILLLEDAGDFYRCYYYLSAEGEPGPIALDRDAVIEFPFNGEMNDGQRLQVEKLEAMGFRLGRESGVMRAAPEQAAPGEGTDTACQIARDEDAAGVLRLVSEAFNPLFAFLPTPAELDASIREGRVLVIREGEAVVAALISGLEKRVASIHQVAVAPECRGRGLGRSIVRAYHDLYAGQVSAYQHWVDLNNAPAVNMYLGLGYRFGTRKANEYIIQSQGREHEA